MLSDFDLFIGPVKNGPCQYRSRTVFENAAPELVRDFFWDDEFRPKWDNMLASSTTIEECPNTGNMVVQWIRKVSLFYIYFGGVVDVGFECLSFAMLGDAVPDFL